MTQLKEHFIKRLKEDYDKYSANQIKKSSYLCKVWYWPENAWFLFDDTVIDFTLIKELINEKVLVFKGIKLHQAIKMALYEPDFTHSAFNYTSNLHIQKNVTN